MDRKSSRILPASEGKFPTWDLILVVLKAPAYRYEGVRKIVTNLVWAPESLPSVTYEELGYTLAKAKQLQRNYWDEARAEEFRQLRAKRKKHGFSVLSMHPHGEKKREDSMGFCIDTIVAQFTPDRTDATIFYRSTEVTRKHAGDLCFLPWIFDQLDLQPQTVTFQYAAAYLSGVFVGTLFRYMDPIDVLETIQARDPILFRGGMRFLYRAVQSPDLKFPYSPEDREHKLLWKILSVPQIEKVRAYLTARLPEEYTQNVTQRLHARPK